MVQRLKLLDFSHIFPGTLTTDSAVNVYNFAQTCRSNNPSYRTVPVVNAVLAITGVGISSSTPELLCKFGPGEEEKPVPFSMSRENSQI